MTHASFTPALDEHGSPIASVYTSAVIWGGNDPRPFPQPAGLEVDVNQLPEGHASPLRIYANIIVDEAGFIEYCEADTPKGLENLNAISCSQVKSSWHASIVKDGNGVAERSFQSVPVFFVAGPSKP
jgi:hypothetical protein